MLLKLKHSFKSIKRNLRVRVALSVALPILLLLTLWSFVHYWSEQKMLEEQLQLSSMEISEALLGGLNHAFLRNDRETIMQIVCDVGAMENIKRVQIIDLSQVVKADSLKQDIGVTRQTENPGCRECHRFPPSTRPQSTRLSLSPDILRIAIPINNKKECSTCHQEEMLHLGVLITDVSLGDMEQHLLKTLRKELFLSFTTMALLLFGIYFLINNLVVRRMLSFREPLAKLAAGDFSTRLAVSTETPDELDNFANTLNQMASKLEQHAREEKNLQNLRQQAIAEERSRMARDLHDGLAQLLAYVNTKAMAVRMMLKNKQLDEADKTLLQLEEAARGLFAEVREAIMTLKAPASSAETQLCNTLQNCTAQFSRLNNIPVDLSFEPDAESIPLSMETKQELFRIVQEALTNVRKHASATKAWVSLYKDNHYLILSIKDDGVGFNPQHATADKDVHLGLGTMRERAENIGATFSLKTKPGQGTHIIIRLPLSEED